MLNDSFRCSVLMCQEMDTEYLTSLSAQGMNRYLVSYRFAIGFIQYRMQIRRSAEIKRSGFLHTRISP